MEQLKNMTLLDTIKKELKEWYIAIFKAKRPGDIQHEIFKEFEKEYMEMTENQCYDCKYYEFEYIGEFTDEWCRKNNEHFMENKNCPNWKER